MVRSLQEGRLKFAQLTTVVFLVFHEPFLSRYLALYAIAFSVLDTGVIYGLGFNSQTLSGSI